MKYLSAIVMVSLVSVFVSCGSADNANTNTSALVEYSGVLQRVVKSDVPSVYLFVNDDSAVEDYYLESSTINLDQFLNEEVVIRGYLKDPTTKLFFITDAWNKDKSMDGDMATSVYSDASFGLKFSYPSTWRVSKKDQGKLELYTRERDETVGEITRIQLTGGTTLDSWVAENYPRAETAPVVVGASAATEVVGEGVTVFQTDDVLFQFQKSYNGEDTALIDREYSMMLASVRVFSVDEALNENSSMENENSAEPSNENNVGSAEVITSTGDELSSGATTSSSEQDTTSGTNQNTSTTTKKPTSTGTTSNTNTTSDTKQTVTTPEVVAAVSARKDLLTAEGTPVISKVEVADGNYVYVTYTDGDEQKKVLFQYAKSGGDFDFSQVGEFKQGTTQSWEKVSGNNVAFDKAREIYEVDTTGEVKNKTKVSEGKSIYTNKQLDFNVEYPRNWYYAGENISSKGGLQKVTFSDAPIDEEPGQKVEIEVYNKGAVDVSTGTKTSVAGKEAYLIKDEDGNDKYVIEGSDGRTYVTSSTNDSESINALKSAIDTLDK